MKTNIQYMIADIEAEVSYTASSDARVMQAISQPYIVALMTDMLAVVFVPLQEKCTTA